jgi:D-sedoheptulose 7-phosphate isomerase
MGIKRFRGSVDEYFEQVQTALSAGGREPIHETVRILYRAWEQGRRVFLIGNGGSASTASHMANDLAKATIVPGRARMKVLSLADNISLISAWGNDSSFDVVFSEQLVNLLEAGDVVLAITASGNSPNILRAMEYAREQGAVTIAWTGRSGGRVKEMVDCCVHAATDDVGMIESVHLVVDHLVADMLRQWIEAGGEAQAARRFEELRAVSA